MLLKRMFHNITDWRFKQYLIIWCSHGAFMVDSFLLSSIITKYQIPSSQLQESQGTSNRRHYWFWNKFISPSTVPPHYNVRKYHTWFWLSKRTENFCRIHFSLFPICSRIFDSTVDGGYLCVQNFLPMHSFKSFQLEARMISRQAI